MSLNLEIAKLHSNWTTGKLAIKEFPRIKELALAVKIDLNGSYQIKMSQELIYFKAEFKAKLIRECDLCFKPIDVELDDSFEILLQPMEYFNDYHGSKEITMENADIDFYQGKELDIAKLVEDQLILELPQNIFCSENCTDN